MFWVGWETKKKKKTISPQCPQGNNNDTQSNILCLLVRVVTYDLVPLLLFGLCAKHHG